MEIFKKSEKSICHECFNVNALCNTSTLKTCDTDPSIKAAYIKSCDYFNKDMSKRKTTNDNRISIPHKRETRVEMMGGGHSDPEVINGATS